MPTVRCVPTSLVLALPALIATTLWTGAVPSAAHASPARRLARQGVVVVPVPSAVPAPPVVVPLPGALPVITSRPLRPWRKSIVQPVAVVVPVPVAPLVVGPTVAAPVSPLIAIPQHVSPGLLPIEPPPLAVPQPVVPQSPTPAPVEAIPAPRAAGVGEPELRFATP